MGAHCPEADDPNSHHASLALAVKFARLAARANAQKPDLLLLYGHPHEAAVLGPRPVVVRDLLEPEELVQHEP